MISFKKFSTLKRCALLLSVSLLAASLLHVIPSAAYAQETAYQGSISLPEGQKATSDITIEVMVFDPVESGNVVSDSFVIKKGKKSVSYSIQGTGAPGESVRYRILGENSFYVTSGFLYPSPAIRSGTDLGDFVLARGSVLFGKVTLPYTRTAGFGGMNLAVEADYITSFMTIPEGSNSGYYRLVVPSDMTCKLFFSVQSGHLDGLADEWVYSEDVIGESFTNVIASDEIMPLKDQVIPAAGIIAGTIRLPSGQTAKSDLTISISAKILLDPPGIAKNETPLEALYTGLSRQFVIPAGESTAAFSLNLPKSKYALEYRVVSGLSDEDVNPKGTFIRGNSRVSVSIKNKDSLKQDLTLNKKLKYYDFSGTIVLPAGVKAKAGGLKVYLDIISQGYATNVSFIVPEGADSVPYTVSNLLEGSYSVTYSIVEQAADYPGIKYSQPLRMVTLKSDMTDIRFDLIADQNSNKPLIITPKMNLLFSEDDPATVPQNTIPESIPVGTGKIFYVSSSTGSNDNDGLSEKNAFQTFAPLRKIIFMPGDRILLKAGDVWEDALYLRGRGKPEAYIQVSSYGKGDKPLITGKDQAKSILLQLENPSYWSVDGLSFKKAKLGIYLHYTESKHKNVSIRNCDFDYFTDGPTVTMDKTDATINSTGGQIAFAAGIFLGGTLNQSISEDVVLDGWEVKDCNFNYCDVAIANNWYRQVFYKDRTRNVFIENAMVTDFTVCAIALNQINGAKLSNVILYNSIEDVFTEFGIAGMFFHGCSNMTIDRYIVNELNRGYSGDGGSIDFEYCKNVIVDNSTFGNIDGMGLELLDTTPFIFDMEYLADRWLLGYNRNISIRNTVFYNTSRRPHTLPSGEDLFFDVYNRNARATIHFENVVFFEGRGSHGSFSAKSMEFTTKDTIRVNLDLVLLQEESLGLYEVYTEKGGTAEEPSSTEIPLYIIIVGAAVLFAAVLFATYKLAAGKKPAA